MTSRSIYIVLGGNMQRLRWFPRPLIILITLLSLILCPLTSGKIISSNNASAEPLNQIDFTPDITPLALTQTAESIQIDPNLRSTPMPTPTYGPGQYFEGDDPNRPELNKDLIIGDNDFGYARLTENPDLYAVWITDESGIKQYLIVDKKSEVLTGGTDPDSGFFTLIRKRDEKFNLILTAADQRNEHKNTGDSFAGGIVVTGFIWGACILATGGLCLPFGGVFGGFIGLTFNEDSDARIQQTIIDGYQREVAQIESDLRGQFTIGRIIHEQP
jgi:hypothetical protein